MNMEEGLPSKSELTLSKSIHHTCDRLYSKGKTFGFITRISLSFIRDHLLRLHT